ncbi:MAG: sulfotransferase [Rhodanobacter sp.]
MATAWAAGDMERVIDLAGSAHAQSESVLLWLGLAQQSSGRSAEAASSFRRLTQMQPETSAYWNNLAIACRQAGDLAAAEHAALTARALAPNDAEVHYNLGLLYTQQLRWSLARQSLLDAVELASDFIEARLQAAHACYVCGDNSNQQAMLAGAAGWPAQPAEQALLLAAMLSAQGDVDAALQALAQAQLPDGEAAASMRLRVTAQRVVLHERNNQLALAQQELRNLPLAALDALPAHATRARIEGWRAHATMAARGHAYADAAALYRRAMQVDADAVGSANAGFGLASACDRQGLHDQAWAALLAAHAAQLGVAGQVVPELLAPQSQPLQLSAGVVDHAVYAAWTALSAPGTQDSPVFVVGFPRSGTTLLEQMLDAHPHFQSMDEHAFIHELIERMQQAGQSYPDDLAHLTQTEADQLRAVYWRLVNTVVPDLGTRTLVDKNPLNMLCLPMIMRLFPHARIIVCLRHPCDVLLSCSMQPFRSPAFMVLCSSLPRLADGYVHAFEQWYHDVEVFAPRVLQWRYESVVSQFDEQVARLAEFLQITDASVMGGFAEHARNKRFISTPSYAQVTEGVHRKAIGRWRNYQVPFEPVLPLLRPWIERLGYSA